LSEIRNPNLQTQGPGSGSGGGDMRTMLAVMTLVIAVLFGYQLLNKPKAEPPAPQQQQQQQQQSQSAPLSTAATQPVSGQSGLASKPGISAASESDTTIENDLYRVTFTNRGAQVKSWVLKHYNDSFGSPLDLVQQQAAQRFGRPLSLFTYESALNTQLNTALYQTTAPSRNFAPQAVSFHYAMGGLDVVKTFRFDSSYVVTVEVAVKRNGVPVRALVQWPSGLGDQEEFIPPAVHQSHRGQVKTPSSFAWSLDGKQDYEAASKVGGGATLEGDYQYVAVSDLYFAAAFMPEAPTRTTVVTLHNAIDLPTDLSDPNSQKRPADLLGLAVGDTSGNTRLRIYAGPKQMEVLGAIHARTTDGAADGPDLKPLVQFGWLKPISYPLYLALRFLYEHGIGNWGWSIILITLIFNLLMLPTRMMMMKSSLKMARIQPKVEALKKRYAHLKMNDPKRAEMNAEMMGLYKTEGVNMYGGCLPMLLQMPLFFALYRLLANVIELRQAQWGWLTDLSLTDPYYILPAVIIICMFVTQLITPAPGMDPSQRRMMAFMMPVIMGFSLAHFPSGLAIYWATGNVVNLLIQLGINQSSLGKEMHAIAAKRAAKKLGAPRVIQGKR